MLRELANKKQHSLIQGFGKLGSSGNTARENIIEGGSSEERKTNAFSTCNMFSTHGITCIQFVRLKFSWHSSSCYSLISIFKTSKKRRAMAGGACWGRKLARSETTRSLAFLHFSHHPTPN